MADNTFDRAVANYRTGLSAELLNRSASLLDKEARAIDYMNAIVRNNNVTPVNSTAYKVTEGFYKLGFQPYWSGAGMGVTLRAGRGYKLTTVSNDIDGVPGLDDYGIDPLVLDNAVTITAPNGTANARVDLIQVKIKRVLTDSASLRYLSDPAAGTITTVGLDTTMSYNMVSADIEIVAEPANNTGYIGYKTGLDDGSLTIPSVDIGYIAVGYVYVPAFAAALTAANIYDIRNLLNPGRVSVSLEKDAGTGGSFTLYSICAPPGVSVYVTAQATAKCSYTIYVFAGNAKIAYDALGVTNSLPVCVTSGPQATFAPVTETMDSVAVAAVVALGAGDVVDLANAAITFPATLTTLIDTARYAYRITVQNLRNNATVVDYNCTNAFLQSVVFDIPEL